MALDSAILEYKYSSVVLGPKMKSIFFKGLKYYRIWYSREIVTSVRIKRNCKISNVFDYWSIWNKKVQPNEQLQVLTDWMELSADMGMNDSRQQYLKWHLRKILWHISHNDLLQCCVGSSKKQKYTWNYLLLNSTMYIIYSVETCCWGVKVQGLWVQTSMLYVIAQSNWFLFIRHHLNFGSIDFFLKLPTCPERKHILLH